MRKFAYQIILLFLINAYSQSVPISDYEIINDLTKNLKNEDNTKTVILNGKSIAFENLNYFFDKKYIEDFISSTPNLSRKEKYSISFLLLLYWQVLFLSASEDLD